MLARGNGRVLLRAAAANPAARQWRAQRQLSTPPPPDSQHLLLERLALLDDTLKYGACGSAHACGD